MATAWLPPSPSPAVVVSVTLGEGTKASLGQVEASRPRGQHPILPDRPRSRQVRALGSHASQSKSQFSATHTPY